MQGRLLACVVVAVGLLLASPAAAHVKNHPAVATLETNTEGSTPGTVRSDKAACEKDRKVTLTDEAGFLGDDTSNARGRFRVPGIPTGDVSVEVKKETIKSTRKHKHRCKAFAAGPIDVTGPTVSITSPDEEGTSGPAGTIIYTTGDSVTATCELNGAAMACDLSGQFQFSGLSDDGHAFSITGTDDSGNETETSVNWNVDATPPTVTGFAILSGGGTGGTVQYFLSDDSSITEIRCELDDAPDTSCGSGTFGSMGWDGLVEHRIEVYGIDEWGNSGVSTPVAPPPATRAFTQWDFSQP